MSRPATQHKRATYPAYRPSGVVWLGEIPEHWELRRLKYTANLINVKADGADNDLAYTGLEHIESWTGRRVAPNGEATSEGQANLYRRGDVLFGKLRPYLAKAHAAESDGICTGELLVLRPRAVAQRFLLDYVLNPDFIAVVDSSTYGAKMPRANWDYIGNLPALIPPSEEQRAIAAFLDRETARIDALIEKKRRQIELLQEKRSALISHAVTKGLDPDARMKDSGIEWLGEIPGHWEVRRLKYTASINDEALPETTDPNYEFTYVDIGSVDASKGIVATETYRFENAPSRARRIVRDGDTIVSTVRTYLRAIAAMREPVENMIVSTGFAVVRPRKLDSGYLSYALRSPFFVETVVSRSTGVSYPAINAPEVGNIGVTIPSFDEQRAIAAFLDRETARIDAIVEKVGKSIDLLREYRTALISAAVTGKIKVSDE